MIQIPQSLLYLLKKENKLSQGAGNIRRMKQYDNISKTQTNIYKFKY